MASFSAYKVTNEIQIPILKGTRDEQPGNFLSNLKERLQINIISSTEDEMVFDLIGVDASIANALRRVMLAEV
jgi:DNA-directed RNA polymerase I and III subunit RPAC1